MLKTAAVSVAICVLTCSAAVAKKVKPEPTPAPIGCTSVSGKACMTAPEIDPSSAVAGLTLLAGGLAVMVGRRSRRLEVQAD